MVKKKVESKSVQRRKAIMKKATYKSWSDTPTISHNWLVEINLHMKYLDALEDVVEGTNYLKM